MASRGRATGSKYRLHISVYAILGLTFYWLPKQETLWREFEEKQEAFDAHSLEVLVDTAVRTVFGEKGRAWSYSTCDLGAWREGSGAERGYPGVVLVEEAELHSVWAALSVYGRHCGQHIAVRVRKVTRLVQ